MSSEEPSQNKEGQKTQQQLGLLLEEAYGKIYGLVTMSYLFASPRIYYMSYYLFASPRIYGLLYIYAQIIISILNSKYQRHHGDEVLLCTTITVIVVAVVTGSMLLCTAATMIGGWVHYWW